MLQLGEVFLSDRSSFATRIAQLETVHDQRVAHVG
jgi:hypothetical protein